MREALAGLTFDSGYVDVDPAASDGDDGELDLSPNSAQDQGQGDIFMNRVPH